MTLRKLLVRLLATIVVLGLWLPPWQPPLRSAHAQEPVPGGTLRLGLGETFYWNLDPTGEYDTRAWAVHSNLLVRTLVTYRHVGGADGTELVADLATEVPSPTDNGLTYTFHLKPGILFGPPLNRPITSEDIEYAFARIACRYCGAGYPFYYVDTIEGMRRARDRPRLGAISGIETPDDTTIVFHLTEPTGDFLHRLALPATGPLPREVARCFASSYDGYGRRLISSGPYMIRGSEGLEVTKGCDGMEPISGWRPDRRLLLDRNPNYDPATDDPAIRENFVDSFDLRFFERTTDLFDAFDRGELDGAFLDPPPRIVRRYQGDPELSARLHSNPADRVWYITMNLTQPPFDDVHVRRAVNLVMNKQALRDAWGGPAYGEIATHVIPPTMTGGHPTSEEYDPYATPDHAGDLEAARAEMALSRYDSDSDGRCDSEACNDIVLINRNRAAWNRMQPTVVQALDELGIEVRPRVRDAGEAYTIILDVSRNIPVAMNPGWGKDYPDAWTFMDWLFHSRRIGCDFNTNYALVGATPETKHRCRAEGRFRDLPSVDADIDACRGIFVGAERDQCWIGVDHKLMEEVVPWVPYLWANEIRIVGRNVTKFEWDQFSAEMALSHMAVRSTEQP